MCFVLQEEFKRIVSEFLSTNEQDFVAVHCTHGLNRSGYFIVAYLVETLGWLLHEALRAFSLASPPGLWDRCI